MARITPDFIVAQLHNSKFVTLREGGGKASQTLCERGVRPSSGAAMCELQELSKHSWLLRPRTGALRSSPGKVKVDVERGGQVASLWRQVIQANSRSPSHWQPPAAHWTVPPGFLINNRGGHTQPRDAAQASAHQAHARQGTRPEQCRRCLK